MITKEQAIGVFDSGIGGLSVLKQLVRFMPYENYIYLGDTARVPYGNKSEGTIVQYAKESVKFLLNKDVKLIIVACNTVSAVALEQVKEIAKNIPLIGMILPAAAAAIRLTNTGNIGIIGTRTTIQSNAYTNTILSLSPESNLNIISQECPLFVPFVEEGMFRHPAIRLVAEEYLKTMKASNIDTLILGCTHYPMLNQIIHDVIPEVDFINQIDTGEYAAMTALRLLADNHLLMDEKHELKTKYNIEFYVTDVPKQFHSLSKNLLGFNIDIPILVEL